MILIMSANRKPVDKKVIKDKPIPTIEEIRKLSEKGKTSFEDNQKKAFQMAFNTIIDGAGEKITEAAIKGRTSTELYKWEKVEDFDDNTYKFNGFWFMSIYNNGKVDGKTFQETLEDYFNKNNKGDKMRIYITKDKKNTNKYKLNITWREKKEKEEIDG